MASMKANLAPHPTPSPLFPPGLVPPPPQAPLPLFHPGLVPPPPSPPLSV